MHKKHAGNVMIFLITKKIFLFVGISRVFVGVFRVFVKKGGGGVVHFTHLGQNQYKIIWPLAVGY